MADGKVVIESEFDGKKAEDGFGKFQSKMDQASKKVGTVGKSMTTNLTAPIAGVAGAMAAAAVKAGNWADELLDLEAMTGASTDTLQVWRKQAAQAGVDTDTMANATSKLNKFLGDADEITPKVENSIKKMGFSVQEFADMNPEERMRLTAQALGEMDEKSRIDIANNLKMVEILPVVSEFGAGIEESTQKMLDQGEFIDGDGLNSFNNFRKSIAETKEEFLLLIGNALTPMVETMNSTVVPMLKEHLIPLFQMLVNWLQIAFEWFANLDGNTQKLIITIIAIVAAIGPMLLVLSKLILLFGFLMSPIGLVILIIGVLAAAFIYLWNTSETFRDIIIKSFEAVKEFVVNTIKAIKDFILEKLDVVFKFWEQHGEDIKKLVDIFMTYIKLIIDLTINNIVTIFKVGLEVIKTAFKVTWEAIKLIISTVLDVILGIFKFWISVFKGDWQGAWDAIKGIFTNSLTNIVKFLKNIGSIFFNAGKGLMNAMKDGIMNAAKAVLNSVKEIAGKVRDFLPFSPAKTGPLSDLDKLDFGGVIEGSILKDVPKVELALSKMLNIPDNSMGGFSSNNITSDNNNQQPKRESNLTVNFNDIVVADKQGLRKLERMLRSVRIDENQRLGVDTE